MDLGQHQGDLRGPILLSLGLNILAPLTVEVLGVRPPTGTPEGIWAELLADMRAPHLLFPTIETK